MSRLTGGTVRHRFISVPYRLHFLLPPVVSLWPNALIELREIGDNLIVDSRDDSSDFRPLNPSRVLRVCSC